MPFSWVVVFPGSMRVLSQIAENRKVEACKPLILRHTIFTFGLNNASLRQNRMASYKLLDMERPT
jgi:hypothetical protein